MTTFIKNLKNGLQKTRDNLTHSLKSIFGSGKGNSEELLDDIEETLILCDIGVETASGIIDEVREFLKKHKDMTYDQLADIVKVQIKKEVDDIVSSNTSNGELPVPYVILVVGVNGTGKTTSIAKLAYYYKSQGKKVLLAAADTFRAAAVEQLDIWREEIGVDIVKNKEGTDPAAVAFDSAQAALARNIDILLVDTAGRIHTNLNLMQELEKIKRVIGKIIPGAPHKIMLVVDANMGMNSITQAKIFTETVDVNGIFLAKLDGTAKGGTAVPIMKNLNIPIDFVGVGESKEDIRQFDLDEFISALFVQ